MSLISLTQIIKKKRMAENLLTFSPLLLISVHQLNCFEIIHSFLCSHCCHKIYVWMNIKHLIVFHLSTLNTIKRNIKSAIFYFWWHFLWYITILFNIHTEFFFICDTLRRKTDKKVFPLNFFIELSFCCVREKFWSIGIMCDHIEIFQFAFHYIWFPHYN